MTNKHISSMDLTGRKFGRLTVIKRAEKSKNGVVRWKCKCECGNEKTVIVYQLINGHTQSCGCLNKEISKERGMNLTGMKFGRLTVIERVEYSKTGRIRWKCKCDCGNEKIINGQHLRAGNIKSCGCLRHESEKQRITDITGNRYGKLFVMERVENNKWNKTCFKCKCDCGNEITVDVSSLQSGKTKSCGCYHKDVISKPLGEAYFNRIIKEYKRGAKEYNREFLLSDYEFKELILADCFYCGAKPSQQYKNTRSDGSLKCNGTILYNGIDRIDNSEGYVQGNVRTCCKQCNYAKHNHTEEEFELWVKAVYQYLRLSEED